MKRRKPTYRKQEIRQPVRIAWVLALLFAIVSIGAITTTSFASDIEYDKIGEVEQKAGTASNTEIEPHQALAGQWVVAGDFSSRIEAINQDDVGMPGGCEVVSATALMRAFGFDITPDDIADNLVYNEDGEFSIGYGGSPYAAGAGYPPVIADAMNKTAGDASLYEFSVADGTDFDVLLSLANNGVPCLVWTTMGLSPRQETDSFSGEYEWYENEHCVALLGGNGEANTVSVMDPLEDGLIERDRDMFEEIYDECGSMCIRVKTA